VPQRIFIKLDKCPKHWPFLLFVSLRLLATTQYRPRLGFIEGQFFALGYLAIPNFFLQQNAFLKGPPPHRQLFFTVSRRPRLLFYGHRTANGI
jgi:hypothetical protein